MQVEVIAIGDQLGFLVPQEILDRYNVGTGDELLLKEIPGGYLLTRKEGSSRPEEEPNMSHP
jgi:hypothetical protein